VTAADALAWNAAGDRNWQAVRSFRLHVRETVLDSVSTEWINRRRRDGPTWPALDTLKESTSLRVLRTACPILTRVGRGQLIGQLEVTLRAIR